MTLTQFEGYFISPKAKIKGKVLVLHAWWGLNQTIKDYCDRLAEEGFAVYAPDVYHGKLTDEIEIAEQYSNDLKLDQARIDLDHAIQFFLTQEPQSVKNIAVIGFSLGAFLALDLSNNHSDLINKVVVYYGTGPDDYSDAKATYLGHFAEFDVFEPTSNIEELETALRESNRPYSFHQYPNTGHWFCEPDRLDAFKKDAAKLAWERTITFLKGELNEW